MIDFLSKYPHYIHLIKEFPSLPNDIISSLLSMNLNNFDKFLDSRLIETDFKSDKFYEISNLRSGTFNKPNIIS